MTAVLIVAMVGPPIVESKMAKIYIRESTLFIKKSIELLSEYREPLSKAAIVNWLTLTYYLQWDFIYHCSSLLYEELMQNMLFYVCASYVVFIAIVLMIALLHSLNEKQWMLLKDKTPVHNFKHRFIHALLQQTIISPVDLLCRYLTGKYLADYITGHTLAESNQH